MDKEKIIKPESSQLISDVEQCFKQLYKNKTFDLLLATNLKGRTLGTYASLIQFISTWSRISSGRLRTYISGEDETKKQLVNLCNEFHGVVALYMSSNKKIISRTGNFEVNKTAENVLLEKLSAYKTNSVKFRASYDQRDKGVLLACFDHSICESPPYFYETVQESSKYQILPESRFIDLVKSVLDIISNVELSRIKDSYTKKGKQDIHDRLGVVAKELIENTDWWARHHFDSRKSYNPNVRGMLLQFDTNEWTKKDRTDKDPLSKYITGIKKEVIEFNKKGSRKRVLAFFELSIFDSGPGLARRWSAKDFDQLTLTDELNAVLNCLQENMSTDTSSISTMRGYGLPKVLKIIGEKGFIRLRSGRLSLYRNFATEPLNEDFELKKKGLELFDWQNQASECSEMSIAEGTLITILYPFTYPNE